MNKKIILVFIPIILLACNFLFPPRTPTKEPAVARPTEEVSPSSDSQDPMPTGFSIVRLHPKDGNLQTLLADESQKALALGQMPVVEFDATWCPPCRAIDEAIKAKNELMLKAYAGTYIIKLDVDEWGWGDSKLHDFQFNGIPVYFKLDSQGKQTGEVIDGGAWGEDVPKNIAPVMDKFFHGE
jgi:thiol-disulfide isomerase/thioredoxin